MLFEWFSCWLLSLLLGLICLFFIMVLKNKKEKFKRLGGVAIIISSVAVIFFSGLEITLAVKIIIGGGLAIGIFGVWDDWKNLSWKKQLLFQIGLVLVIIFSGLTVYYISLGGNNLFRLDSQAIDLTAVGGQKVFIWSGLFIFFWYLTIINAINWTDGIDGLAGGVGIIATLSIMMVSLRPEVNQPALAILSLIFIGGLLGFLWFNFPPAKIIAGTSGSYFIGFILATLAIMAGTKIATLLIVLALPIIDFIWVIFNRFKSCHSIFAKDKNKRHFHYQLRCLGWSDRKIFLSYFSFLFIIFLLTVFLDNRQFKLWILGAEMIFIGGFIFWVNKKVKKLRG